MSGGNGYFMGDIDLSDAALDGVVIDGADTLPVGIDGESFLFDLSRMSRAMGDYIDENIVYFDSLNDEQFEALGEELYGIGIKARRALGTVCWKRLVRMYGVDKASDSGERYGKIQAWAQRFGCEYHALDRLVKDAEARELNEQVEGMSVTAGANIVRAAGETEAERQATVDQRVNAANQLDTGNNSTKAVADAKRLERAGVREPNMLWRRDLREQKFQPDIVIMYRICVGQHPDENGVVIDDYEWREGMSIYFEEPKSEETREQHKTYENILRGRLAVKRWEYEPE